jgi:hypothetical protein
MPPNAASLPSSSGDIVVERYKFILQQIHASNENVYRFLAIYQGLATALATAGVTLFVGYGKWRLDVHVAKTGLSALLWLLIVVAAFTILLVLAGVLSWFDYRKEECVLTDQAIYPGYRTPPRWRNFYRWYETYIVLFIGTTAGASWLSTHSILLPAMK